MSTVLTTPEAPGRGPVTDLLTGGGPVRRALWLAARRAGAVLDRPGDQRRERADVVVDDVGRAAARRADRAGRAGRAVLRARRRGQHRPRGHDDPRHLGRRLGRLPVGLGGRARRRACSSAPSAGCCTPLATVTFGVDHVVSGVAINILAAGVVRFLSELLYTDNPAGGGVTQSPAAVEQAADVLAAGALLGAGPARRRRGAALVPDQRRRRRAARGHPRGRACSRCSPCCSIPASYLLLWRTAFGLRLRSCGENPAAADSLGVAGLPDEVHRGGHLRRAGRPGWRVPRLHRRHLPREPDQRPRLHRPRRADLRQLAARGPGRRCEPVRLRRRAAAAQPVGGRRAAAPGRACCSPSLAIRQVLRGQLLAGGIAGGRRASPRWSAT